MDSRKQGVELVAGQGAHVYVIRALMSASYPLAVTAASGKPRKEGCGTPEPVVIAAGKVEVQLPPCRGYG